jgi:serine/threonine-protein kinase
MPVGATPVRARSPVLGFLFSVSAMSELSALAAALTGQYDIQCEIGRGGMGVVYLARDLKLDRLVAIKTLPPHLAGNADVRERFLREARTAAHLSHPNIVPVHRADEIGGQVFFVMGYVEGESLAQRIQEQGRPPFAGTISQLRDVALALGYAHARGVIHRDVKAENILIERATERALVTDFGIARLAESKPLTATGQVLGTVHYMSPEQVTGDAVDGRSDVYALGVVAFLALSGKFPFDSDTPSAVLVSHVMRPTPRLLDVAPDVPPAIAAIVDRCLAKNPNDRFETSGALAEALERVRADATQADRDRDAGARSLISETQAQSVWRRAAELQAFTRSQPAPPLPQLAARPAHALSQSSAYQLADVKASAVDAGIPETFVQQALREHGLVPSPGDSSGSTGRAEVSPRRTGALPAVVVKDGPPQPVNMFLGTATRIVVEATIEGEVPERDYDLVLDVIRREIGEVGQIGSVGRTFSWSVSNQNRKLQISVMPRGGRTTVRIDEQINNIAGGVFGGIMGGGGGGLGGAMMGAIAGGAHQPLLGLAAWLATIAAAFGTARFTLGRIAKSKREKLTEIAHLLANQIAESTASGEATDSRKRIGSG